MLNLIRNTVSNFRLTKAKQDANNFLAAAGITGQVQSQAIYNLVNDLQTSGLWSKMKAIYPMVTDNYNLLSYTEDFANAAWLNDQASSTANQTIAPNGTNTADKLIENSANNHHLNYQSVSATVGQIYTFSVYLKAAERSYAAIQVADSVVPVNRYTVLVDLINGTILGTRNNNSPTNTSSSIQSVGNGWYRVTATMKQVAGTSFFGHIATSNSATPTYDTIDFPTYTGNGTSGIFIWGAQIELGISASAYQPVLGSQQALIASQMKYNLKDARDLDAAFRLTWSGGWTYSATGATPNGTNAYADTKLSPSTSLSLNSTHISYYSRTQSNGTEVEIGSANTGGVNGSLIEIRTSGVTYYRVNSGITFLTYTDSDSRSFYIANRTASNIVNGWRNSSKVVSGTTASSSLNSENYYLGALNQANSALYFSTKQASFASIGDGLTDQDAQLLNQIVEKYQVALSRGVQAAQSFYYNSAYSNEANTYLYSTQITGTTQVSAINTLINGLKANNLWSKMKAVYPFVTDKWNVLGFTEDLTNAAWTKANTTITANSILAPDGTTTADSLLDTATNAVHYCVQTTTQKANRYNYSVYLKYQSLQYVAVDINDGTNGIGVVIDIQNGTYIGTMSVGSGFTLNSYAITSAGNGWYRCSVDITFTGAGSASAEVVLRNSNTTSWGNAYAGSGNGVYVWGAQLEQSSTLSTYQAVLGANSYSSNVAAQMKFNLVNPQDTDAAFRLAFSGGWTYSTNGAQPNGTNGFANTYALIPSQNSGSLGFYSRTNSVVASCSFGGTTVQSGLFLTYLANQSFLRINDAGNSPAISTTDSFGLFIANRVSGTETRNLVKGAIVAQSANSIGTQSAANYIGALNSAGSGSLYDNKQCAFAFVADGFSDAELLLLNTLINSYQTSLSRNV